MSLSSRDYAALAENAYRDREPGRQPPDRRETLYLNDHQYRVVEHVSDSRTGYQGTLYQHVRTRNFVVAHRGTEEILEDALITDASMLLARTSPQASPALALTRRAIEDAETIRDVLGDPIEVTVTGHSLGGTLAQISAHHFNLRGETFNAYGAASLLGLRIPEGGSQVVNHAMAADAVSAASPHFGEVRLYATERELEALSRARYGNSAFNAIIPKLPLVAAAATLDSHRIDQFTGDESVLANKHALWLAEDNAPMIASYRRDLDGLRTVTTLGARGAPGNMIDAYEKIRGPLEPGEPARREAERLPEQAPPVLLNDPAHPGHARYERILDELHKAEATRGIPPGPYSEKVAAALVVESERHGLDVMAVHIGANGRIEGVCSPGPYGGPRSVHVSAEAACAVTVEDHSRSWDQLRAPDLGDDLLAAPRPLVMRQTVSGLSQADQAMFARIRQDVPDRIGDDQVMRALHDARKANISGCGDIDRVVMSGERICVAGTIPGFRSMTDTAHPAPALQESVEQVERLNQQVGMEQQQPGRAPRLS